MFATSATMMFLEGEQSGPSFLPILGAMALIWVFIVILPARKDKKRKAEMMANLKKGDRLLFQNGLVGKLVTDKGTTLVAECQGSKFEILKDQVVRVLDEKSES
ncbi:MAG: preprotein translocase subunit YajC [Planctomycetes bacterium]|nr:preprotein translocase subunit YajC [Planctomycetota bacterium]